MAYMFSNRTEGFRYQFGNPLPCHFQIKKVDGELIDSSEGPASIQDISPSGMRFNSELFIPETEQKDIQLSIRFTLNEYEYKFFGSIVWKKEYEHTCDYGIQLDIGQEEEEELIEQLKVYSKRLLKENNK
ncbi:PilZ domain-containing protein [Pontibacillus marinus]|nr:PilZ domain-containing protein [Pontibacillus marinus]